MKHKYLKWSFITLLWLMIIGFAAVTNAQSLTDSLQRHWILNGNGNELTGKGTALIGMSGLTTDRFGHANSAYINSGFSLMGTHNPLQQELTINFWINPRKDLAGVLPTKTVLTEFRHTWDFEYVNGQLKLSIYDASVVLHTFTLTTTLSKDQWYMVSIVNNTTTNKMYFYIDGVAHEVGTALSSIRNLINQRLSFGANYLNNGYYSYCTIDDYRLYNRALSSSEITQLYQQVAPSVGTAITDQTINQGINSTVIIQDLNTHFSKASNETLTYLVTASYPTLINVSLEGNSLIAQPKAQFFGQSEIIVSASDTYYTIADTFNINVTPTRNEPDSALLANFEFNNGSQTDSEKGIALSVSSGGAVPLIANDHHNQMAGAFNFVGIRQLGTNGYTSAGATEGYSIATWFKPSTDMNASSGQRVFYTQYITSALYYNGGKLKFDIYDTGGTKRGYTFDTTFVANQWYHLAVSITAGEKIRLFINNQAYEMGTAPASIRQIRQTLHIGSDHSIYRPKDNINAVIDEMKFYKKAITPNEVNSLFNKSFTKISQLKSLPDLYLSEDFDTLTVASLDTNFTHPAKRPIHFSATADTAGLNPFVYNDSLYLVSSKHFNGKGEIFLHATDSAYELIDTLVVNITAVNDTPRFELPTRAISISNIASDSIISLQSMHPSDESAVQYSISPNPNTIPFIGLSIDSIHHQLTISPVSYQHGTQQFYITASDQEGLSFTDSITITSTPSYFTLNKSIPSINGINVKTDTDITLIFDKAILSNQSLTGVSIIGDQSGAHQFITTGLGTDTVKLTPSTAFFPNEWVHVSLKGLRSQGGFSLPATDIHFQTNIDISKVSGTVSFEEVSIGKSFAQPRRVLPTDIDQDGDVDLVVPYYQSHKVVLYENKGDLNFEQKVIAELTGAINTKAADMDGDGDIDLIAYGFSYRKLTWLENDGSENFQLHIIDSTAFNTRAILPMDIDHDGDMDVITGNQNNGNLIAWLNDGAQNFSDTLLMGGLGQIQKLMIRDYDNNGKVDILAHIFNTGDLVVIKQGEGLSFTKQALGISNQSSYGLAVGDFSNNGLLDVFNTTDATWSSRMAYLQQNPNNGLFYNFLNFTNTIRNDKHRTISMADFNGDGLKEIVSGSYVYTNKMYFGRPNMESNYIFSSSADAQQIPSVIKGLFHSAVADMDNDGDLDYIACGLSSNHVMIYNNKIINLLPDLVNPIADQTIQEAAPALRIPLKDVFSSPTSLTFTASSDTAEISVSISNDTLVVATNERFYGTANIKVTADNGSKQKSDEFKLTVHYHNDAPTLIGTDTLLIHEDQDSTSFNLQKYFEDEEENPIRYQVSGGTMASYQLVDSILTIHPNKNVFGLDSFYVSTTDLFNAKSNHWLYLKIKPVNDAPVFSLSDSSIVRGLNFQEETKVSFTDLSPENEQDQTIQYSITPNLDFVTVTIDQQAKEMTFVSVKDSSGTALLTVTANDGGDTLQTYTQQFRITVTSNFPPTANDTITNQVTEEDAARKLIFNDITSLFTDPENDSISYSVQSDTSAAMVSIDGKSLYFESEKDFFGVAVITLTATDQLENSSYESFTVTVENTNDAPVAQDTIINLIAVEDSMFSHTFTNTLFSDIDQDSLSYQVVNLPDWLNLNGLTISGTPGNEDIANTTLQLTGSDGLLKDSITITLSVTAVNDAPVATDSVVKIELQEDDLAYTFDLNTIFSDEDSPLSFSLQKEDKIKLKSVVKVITPASIAHTEVSGNNLIVTPLSNTNGTQSIEVIASDGSLQAYKTIELVISSVNDAPVFSLSKDTFNLDMDFDGTEEVLINLGAVPSDEQNQTISYTVTPLGNQHAVNVSFSGQTIALTAIAGQKGSTVITITADDGQSHHNTYSQTLLVNVRGVERAPTDILLSNQKIKEDLPIGSLVGLLTAVDENEEEIFTYTLNGNLIIKDRQKMTVVEKVVAEAPFKINGDSLLTNTTFDFATQNQYTINIRVQDKDGLSLHKSFSITIEEEDPVAPVDISLSNTSIKENEEKGTFIGLLTTTDANRNESFSYQLDATETAFYLTADSLFSNESFDYETKSSYTIAITVEDKSSLTFTKQLTIDIENETEVLAVESSSIGLFRVFPIPFAKTLTIQANTGTIDTLVLMDSQGKVVKKVSPQKVSITLPTEDLPAGVYHLQAKTSTGFETFKIIK